jgi:hypothetical protein
MSLTKAAALLSLAAALVFVTPDGAAAETAGAGQAAAGQAAPAGPARTPQQAYDTYCVACHGADGKGADIEIAKIVPLPDFSDCSFASREPDADWLAVSHYGGPVRGFSPIMPAFTAMATADELQLAVSHTRTFCQDSRWPRGELNLPRPLITGKAYPEDEAVLTVTSSGQELTTEWLYEKRIGPVDQVEIAVPIGAAESGTGWAAGLGDIALEYKRTLAHSLERGNIFSASAEAILPTGRDSKGLGGGVFVFEPSVTFGQILPRDGFLQAQVGFEIPAADDHENESFWRVAVGKSFSEARFGRSWSPMVELLASRAFETGARIEWDVVPQMQVTLNQRQHVMLSGGVRVPVNERSGRSTQVIVYLLWDWFDGGFTDGW